MSDLKALLELRKKMNAKRPEFIRQSAHKKKRLERKWRSPKGVHSKKRHKMRGHNYVSAGFRAPREARHVHQSGLRIILVHSAKQIEKIDKDAEGAIVAKTVGLRKRIEILKKIKEEGISLFNIKDIDAYLRKNEEKLKKRKEEKKKVKKEREEKKKETEKKAEEKGKKESLAEKIETEEEKKEKEKKEADKLLTKKQK